MSKPYPALDTMVQWGHYTCLVHGKGEVELIWDGTQFYSEKTGLHYQHPDTHVKLAAPLRLNEEK